MGSFSGDGASSMTMVSSERTSKRLRFLGYTKSGVKHSSLKVFQVKKTLREQASQSSENK